MNKQRLIDMPKSGWERTIERDEEKLCPSSAILESYTAPDSPDKWPIETHVEMWGWRLLRFERWDMWYRHRGPQSLYGLKILKFRVLFGAV